MLGKAIDILFLPTVCIATSVTRKGRQQGESFQFGLTVFSMLRKKKCLVFSEIGS